VLPGRLSVCRTFGDPEAKLQFRGGNPNVVMADPDITQFKISKDHDFIALGSDGIFDKLTDEDTGKSVWLSCEIAKT
jgi:protein phosphatase 2C family protein 2/3